MLITTLLWKLFYLLFMLFCMLALLFILPFKYILPSSSYRRLIYLCAAFWGKTTVRSTGSSVSIENLDKLPDTGRICFIGNHQGFFDIPAFLGWIGRPAGFVAKQELFKVPILSLWMQQIPCVFIDRNSARKAMESFKVSAELISNGHPLVIFPEGSRSKSDTMGNFHLGSLKLPAMAKAVIVPFAIKGSWRIMEIDGRIHSAKVKIRVLDPITPDNPIYQDKNALAMQLRSMISYNLGTM